MTKHCYPITVALFLLSNGCLPAEEVQLAATPLTALPVNAEERIVSKYHSGGSATNGAIRDQAGNVIWRATEENLVFSISISPDETRIAVNAGDRNAYIVTAEGKKTFVLPNVPPGKDMLGFGSWIWLDDHRLLGSSGLEKFGTGDDNVRKAASTFTTSGRAG